MGKNRTLFTVFDWLVNRMPVLIGEDLQKWVAFCKGTMTKVRRTLDFGPRTSDLRSLDLLGWAESGVNFGFGVKSTKVETSVDFRRISEIPV
jgi:hypothetical protein